MRSKFFGQQIKLIMLCAVCLFSLLAAPHAFANETCNNSVLDGEYASTVSGQIFHADGTAETRQGVAMMHFNGHGSFTQTDYVLGTLNGATSGPLGPIDSKTGFQNHESGTYQVHSDCTGSLEIQFAPPPVPGATGAMIKIFFVLANHGRSLRSVVVAVTPPSVVPNDIIGFTLHSEGSRVGDISDEK